MAETVDVTQEWLRGQTGSAPLPGEVCPYLLALESVPEAQASPESPEGPWTQEPSPREVWVLHETLDLLERLPGAARSGQVEAELMRARLVPGWPKWAYRSLLEDPAFIGILQTANHPGVLTRFTTARERDRRPGVRVEVSAPLGFWTAADGVNREPLDRLFGHLSRPTRPPHPPAVPARPRIRTRLSLSGVGARARGLP